MLIGGLWHGANWTFVIWGAYHGLLLLLHRRWHVWWDCLPAIMRQLAFFVLVLIGWAFFRSEHLAMALHLLQTMFIPTTGILVEHVNSFLLMLGLAVALDQMPLIGTLLLNGNHVMRMPLPPLSVRSLP
jgi:alginate O-acetyltransferase complex protein AlgI